MTNIDRGALDYIIQSLPVKTMIDVGCGPGGMVKVANEIGIQAIGIDGDPMLSPDIRHDFENGPLMTVSADLAWAVEFLEHVEEQYLDNVFSVFERCKYVFCTHNEKDGPWHSNCRPNEYWFEEFKKRGFCYNELMTKNIKLHSTMEREFVSQTGQFYENGQ
jgi:SAM-dependent methyltransferase